MSGAHPETAADAYCGCQSPAAAASMAVLRLRLLSVMQADRLFLGQMDLPSDNKSLESLRSTYRGLLAQAAARSSRYITVRPPSVRR